MKRIFKTITLAMTSVLLLSSCGVVRKQDQFVLSTFFAVGGSADKQQYTKMLTLTKESGINLVALTFLSGQALDTALQVCEEIQLNNIAQDLTQYSGFGDQAPPFTDQIAEQTVQNLQKYQYNIGFYVWDEPTMEQFENTAKMKQAFQKLAPQKLAFSCIYPSYGKYDWASGRYPIYVDTYLKTVDPPVLSMDYYPYTDENSQLVGSSLWQDLGYLRKKSLETSKPFWFYFQAVGDLQNKTPEFMTVEKTKGQMYAALCYGVKGLSYYTSYGALVTESGEKSENYDALTAVNMRVKAMGNFLLNKTSQAIYQTGLGLRQENVYYLDHLADADFTVDTSGTLLIGLFTDAKNQYMLIVNLQVNDTRPTTGSITFPQSIKATDFDTGQTQQTSTLSLTIEPAEAVLYTISNP